MGSNISTLLQSLAGSLNQSDVIIAPQKMLSHKRWNMCASLR